MNRTIVTTIMICMGIFYSCGNGDSKKESEKITIGQGQETTKTITTNTTTGGPIIDLSNKGIGPIKSIDLPETIDQEMATRGQESFKTKCMACHKPDKRFIGPAPTGIFERRSPEWIMNMILNPEGMVKDDPIAKQLLIEYNGSPMANQNLSQEEARAVLEYFRTL